MSCGFILRSIVASSSERLDDSQNLLWIRRCGGITTPYTYYSSVNIFKGDSDSFHGTSVVGCAINSSINQFGSSTTMLHPPTITEDGRILLGAGSYRYRSDSGGGGATTSNNPESNWDGQGPPPCDCSVKTSYSQKVIEILNSRWVKTAANEWPTIPTYTLINDAPIQTCRKTDVSNNSCGESYSDEYNIFEGECLVGAFSPEWDGCTETPNLHERERLLTQIKWEDLYSLTTRAVANQLNFKQVPEDILTPETYSAKWTNLSICGGSLRIYNKRYPEDEPYRAYSQSWNLEIVASNIASLDPRYKTEEYEVKSGKLIFKDANLVTLKEIPFITDKRGRASLGVITNEDQYLAPLEGIDYHDVSYSVEWNS